MAVPFNADNLFKRSILGSIIGYALKKPKSFFEQSGQSSSGVQAAPDACRAQQSSSVPIIDDVSYDLARTAAQVAVTHGVDNHLLQYRTQQDIYDEIVCECARIESTNSSVQSRSASQSPDPAPSSDDRKRSKVDCGDEISPSQQPPPKSCSETLSAKPQISKNANNVSIEEFVRLVVTAVQESGLVVRKTSSTESPEEILRRKRAQNNEAATRYRRRQKGLRQETETELLALLCRNRELRQQVESMQTEIMQLKTAVLRSQDSSYEELDLKIAGSESLDFDPI